MTSQRKSATSRLNGSKSRGPKTSEGRSRSKLNALRHGLSIVHRANPKFSGAIMRLAKALCENSNDPLLFEQAISMAEADMVIRCARAEQIAVIERLLDSRALPTRGGNACIAEAKARADECWRTHEEILRAAKQTQTGSAPASDPTAPLQKLWTNHKRRTIEALYLAVPALRKLRRYERRAWSRRRRAMRAFQVLQTAAKEAA